MDSIAKGIVIAVLCVLKLVITGICLAIGFKLGYVVYEKAQAEYIKRTAKPAPASQ